MKKKLTYPKKSHKGKAGRKPTPEPIRTKRYRANDDEWERFMSHFAGNDARQDFLIIMDALQKAGQL